MALLAEDDDLPVFADYAYRVAIAMWMTRGNCFKRGSATKLFFPVTRGRGSVEPGKRVCASCPVIAQCREFAVIHGERGIWGNSTDKERQAEKRKRRRKGEKFPTLPGSDRKSKPGPSPRKKASAVNASQTGSAPRAHVAGDTPPRGAALGDSKQALLCRELAVRWGSACGTELDEVASVLCLGGRDELFSFALNQRALMHSERFGRNGRGPSLSLKYKGWQLAMANAEDEAIMSARPQISAVLTAGSGDISGPREEVLELLMGELQSTTEIRTIDQLEAQLELGEGQTWLKLETVDEEFIITLLIEADKPLPEGATPPAPPSDSGLDEGAGPPTRSAKPAEVSLAEWVTSLNPMADPDGYSVKPPACILISLTRRRQYRLLAWLAEAGGVVQDHDPATIMMLVSATKQNAGSNALHQLEALGYIGRQGVRHRIMWLRPEGKARLLELIQLDEAGTLDDGAPPTPTGTGGRSARSRPAPPRSAPTGSARPARPHEPASRPAAEPTTTVDTLLAQLRPILGAALAPLEAQLADLTRERDQLAAQVEELRAKATRYDEFMAFAAAQAIPSANGTHTSE